MLGSCSKLSAYWKQHIKIALFHLWILKKRLNLVTNLVVGTGYNSHKKKLKMTTYFENLTVGFNVHCVLKTRIKFCANQMLFTIRSINLFFMHSFRLQKLEI